MVLAKPAMRALLTKDIKRNVAMALLVSCSTAAAVKYLYNEPLKQKYADFYKNYDAEAAFERMRKKGLFQSCQ